MKTTLTSGDPEPTEGTVVRDACGGTWLNTGDYPAAWLSLDSYIEVETWTKIAGNYGPVVVRVQGRPGA